jgi:hypothetical protein
MFRRATENAEAVSAYRKFLTHAALQESPRQAGQFSVTRFRQKIQTIQAQVPHWVQKTGRADLMQPMMNKLDAMIKSNRFQEADKQADAILDLVTGKQAGAH